MSAPAARLVGRPVGCRKPVWSHWRSVAMLAAAAFAASCARLDVYDVPAAGDTRVHVVRSGETLYRIAARYGLAAADLARWNGLRDPDRIYVGQSLRLSPPPGTATRGAQTAAQRAPEVAPQPAAAQSRTEQPPPVFAWPTDGRVIMQFGSTAGISTGIAIDGRIGQPVRAAAGGNVVYAGSGLVGYGQVVIVMHNDTYLTAYGHLDRLFVEQGQYVALGQTIALMGNGPERAARLHFEVRRNGVPVDPLTLLREPR